MEPEVGTAGTWTLDTAAELGAPGHTLEDMMIEARGSLAPNAYTYGGLVAHGLQGMKLWTHDDTSWAKLQSVTPSGAGLWRGERLDDASRYDYFGITNNTVMTIWFEGEVWLEASVNQTFALGANDVAFVELARPGTTAYIPVLQSGMTVKVPTQEAGWYPIRVGFADGDNSCDFDFLHSDTGTANVAWTRARLRARTSELRGALRTIFDRQILGGGAGALAPVTRFEQGNLVTEPSFDPLPQGVSTTDDWSARYLGQLYVEQPGMYTMTIDSDDGNRGQLGPARGQTSWGRDQGNGDAVTTIPATLGAGWNDLTVDYNQASGARDLRVRITGGGLSNVEIPRDRLRPVESADDRLAFGIDETDRVVPDASTQAPGTVISEMPLPGYTGETVTSIDVTYRITSQRWNDLQVKLERPGLATPITIRPQGNLTSGIHTLQQTLSRTGGASDALLGGPAGGTWKLHVSDVVPATASSTTLQDVRITLHTTGGPPKIAPSASWTSPVLEAPTDVFAIDGITWDARQPDGATIAVVARACRQAGCTDGPAWSEPVTQSGQATTIDLDRGRYLQLRVDMTSDGVADPELRSLSVTYRRSEAVAPASRSR